MKQKRIAECKCNSLAPYSGKEVNGKIEYPITLNEKLQWLKFNYRFPLQTVVSDKLLVRDYVKEKIGEKYLIPLLGSWEKYSDIDFSKLPNKFVLKCNHDSGGLVVCTDKEKLNYSLAKNKIEKSLNSNFFYIGREYQYSFSMISMHKKLASYYRYVMREAE